MMSLLQKEGRKKCIGWKKRTKREPDKRTVANLADDFHNGRRNDEGFPLYSYILVS